MTLIPTNPDIQTAAAAIQLSVAMAQTLQPPELGNECYEVMFQTWIRHGRSADWIAAALDAHDKVERISFTKRDGGWTMTVEWEE